MLTLKKLTWTGAFAALGFWSPEAEARDWRPGQLPNGNVLSCSACHLNPGGGGTRNGFGNAVNRVVNFGSRQPFWDAALAALDSDGDGFTNGEELGDPDGDGIPEPGAEITNPGNARSFPTVVVDPEPVSTTLTINRTVEGAELAWEEGGFLQSATSADGPWSTLDGAESPHAVSLNELSRFYRIRESEPAQIVTVFLGGNQEVPPVNTGAGGSGVLEVSGNTVRIHVAYSGLGSDFAAAHIHGPASAGTNAGVLAPIDTEELHQPDGPRAGLFSGMFEVSDEAAAAILAGEAYVNIHTADNGGGEIRGQTMPSFTVGTFLTGAQEVPPVDSPGAGSGTLTVDGTTLTVNIAYHGLASDFAAAHIHGPAGAGVNAGVLVPLSTPELHQPAGPRAGKFVGSVTISEETAAAILEGSAYVNIHTADNGSGEIRGQIAP